MKKYNLIFPMAWSLIGMIRIVIVVLVGAVFGLSYHCSSSFADAGMNSRRHQRGSLPKKEETNTLYFVKGSQRNQSANQASKGQIEIVELLVRSSGIEKDERPSGVQISTSQSTCFIKTHRSEAIELVKLLRANRKANVVCFANGAGYTDMDSLKWFNTNQYTIEFTD